MSIVTSQAVMAAMEQAGIIRREDNIRRVVIDLEVTRPAVIHVERLGDQKLLSVVSSMVGVEIRTTEPEIDLTPDPLLSQPVA